MAKVYSSHIIKIIGHLIHEYNDFSYLCALNYSQGANPETCSNNRARLSAVNRHLEYICDEVGIDLEYQMQSERFCGYALEYRKVFVSGIPEDFH